MSACSRAARCHYLRRNLGIIFQDHKLLFDRNVFENVVLPLQICGFDYRESHKRARAALDKVGLLKREKSEPIALSGGEQQRLCIARAIVNRPSILLADEPTGNLDTEYAHEIMAIFNSFHQVGVTLVISTHDKSVLQHTGVRILELKHGELQPSTDMHWIKMSAYCGACSPPGCRGFFNILVIGIALSLPAGMYVLLQNAQGLVAQFSGTPQISLFMSMDAKADDIDRVRRLLVQQPAVEPASNLSHARRRWIASSRTVGWPT